MVKPASIPRISGSLACLALLLSGATASAQQAPKPTNSKDTLSEEAVFIPIEYRPPPYQVSVGVHIAGKAKVKFSGLGAIPFDTYPGANADDVNPRTYEDGSVYLDYTYDVNSTKVEPTDGKTNYWSFNNSDQVVENPTIGRSLAFHSYEVVPSGSTAAAEDGSSISWDVEISRQLGGNRRITWGVVFGASLSGINAKTSGTIKANLRTVTDYYSLDGISSPSGATGSTESYPYTWKLKDDGVTYDTDSSGNNIPVYQYDAAGNKLTTWTDAQRLPDHPGDRTDVIDTTNPIDVEGYWKVKGAYITTRFGPYIALQLGRHFAFRASAGLTLAVLGANFTVKEQYLIPSTSGYLKLEASSRDATVSGTVGYFVEGELQAFLTQRTGFFIGAIREDYARDIRLQIYQQVADLSVSSGTAFRTGITTRF